MNDLKRLKIIVQALSEAPGVYQFYDDSEALLYIGKAKNLRKRVNSYFNKKQFENKKTKVLVSRISDIKTIKVETEMDALLLENSLIKKHQPRYNIQLKDDKTYPWICIKNEPFPRISFTRKIIKDGSKYFGPYHSVKMVKYILNFLRDNFNIRNCSHHLTNKKIGSNEYDSAVEYYIGNCKGCCQGEVTYEEYENKIGSVKTVLNGNIDGLIRELKQEIKMLSLVFKYEEAHEIKSKIKELVNYQARSTVVSSTIKNVDVFSIEEDINNAYVNYIKVVNGAIIQSRMLEIKKMLDENNNQLLEMVIADVFQKSPSASKELILPFKIKADFPQKITVPLKGGKRDLLQLSYRNARYYMKEKHKKEAFKNPESNVLRILETIQKQLKLKELPFHMECFDNSNFQGAEPVAACVVFKNAKPQKKEYRHFNINTVVGPDDYASMEEVIFRRYKRILEEKKSLPQLIIVDGGKGQLSSALKSIDQLGLKGKIAVIGIAKKLEEIYYPGDSLPLYIDKRSETLRVIQHMRNEAHRFGLKHHRQRRIKGTLQSQITQIKGVGEKTMIRLIKQFKSINKIKQATISDLEKTVGIAKAKIIHKHFKAFNKQTNK